MAKSPFKADELVMCVESFAGDDVVVKLGQRFRGDDPVVQRAPWAFLRADATQPEINARELERQREYANRLPQHQEAPPSQPKVTVIALRDRVIATRHVGEVGARASMVFESGEPVGCDRGQILSRRMKLVRDHGDAFVPVCGPDVDPAYALVATAELVYTRNDGTKRIIYAGQYVRRDDPDVEVNFPHFVVAPLEVA